MATSVPNPLEQLSIADLRARTSIKWNQYSPDVLPLWVAEMDVALAEPVRNALVAAIEKGDTGYPSGTPYAEALQAFAGERWGWEGLAVDRSAIVPDVMMGIVEMLRLVTSSDDAVVVNSPVYPPFYAFVEHMDRRVVEAPLGADRRIDLAVLEEAFRSTTGGGRRAAYLLCNPHNPVGTVHTIEELTAVAGLAARYGVRVVADEIHAPIVMPGHRFTPYLSVPGAESGISLMSASKAWNLAGLKAAVAVAGTDAVGDLARLPDEVGDGPSHVGIIGHTAALREGGDWLDALVAGLDENRRLLADLLAEHLPDVGYVQPEGTYLAWLDCSALGLGGDPETDAPRGPTSPYVGPAAFFLEHARVALNPGPSFGTGGVGHVRLNLATSRDILTDAVRRMGAAVAHR